MPKIKTITVGAKGNLSHPNPNNDKRLGFSQLTSEVTIEAELEKGDDLEAVFNKLREDADFFVRRHLKEQFTTALNGGKASE